MSVSELTLGRFNENAHGQDFRELRVPPRPGPGFTRIRVGDEGGAGDRVS